MDKLNKKDVPVEHRKSPKEAFEIYRKHVSVAMRRGEPLSTGPWEGGPPFDVEITTVPPGKKNYPYHSHASSWEYYIITSGTGKFRDENNVWHDITQGDHIQCRTKQAHQIWNDSPENLVYTVIASNSEVEVGHYPDTGKIVVFPDERLGYMTEADYYENEE
jgi:uncharacterized cupin superfamily protein